MPLKRSVVTMLPAHFCYLALVPLATTVRVNSDGAHGLDKGAPTTDIGTLRINGACAKQSSLNSDFTVQGVTPDNKPFYQSGDGTRFLSFACGGWMFNTTELLFQGDHVDGNCSFAGFIPSAALLPPAHGTWRMACDDGGIANVSLAITDITYAGWRICAEGSFCHGDGCGMDIPGTPTPRDRWDPEKVRGKRMFTEPLLE